MNIVLKESIKYALRSRPIISREIRFVDWLYSLSSDELQNYKEKQFLRIFKRAYRHSSFYNELYRKSGVEEDDIKSLTDIEKLPVLTKDMVRNNSQKILTVPRWMVVKANTSGTTGTPLTAYHSYKAIRLEQAYIAVRRARYGFHFGEKLISLRGNLGSDSFQSFVLVSNTLYLSSYLINDPNLPRYFDAIKKFCPRAIEGYPSSLYNLAIAFRDKGWSLNIPLCFTSSERLFYYQREVIESVLGCQIFDRYGCTERSVSLAENLDHQGYYEEPGYSHNQFLTDCIISTSLFNFSFPLIRYRVNDIVAVDHNGAVREIEGRYEDFVVCNNGIKIGRLDHIFKGVKGIRFAQILQKVPGHIEINIVPESCLGLNTTSQIEGKLREKVSSDNLCATFNSITVNDLIYSSRNKLSLVKIYL